MGMNHNGEQKCIMCESIAVASVADCMPVCQSHHNSHKTNQHKFYSGLLVLGLTGKLDPMQIQEALNKLDES